MKKFYLALIVICAGALVWWALVINPENRQLEKDFYHRLHQTGDSKVYNPENDSWRINPEALQVETVAAETIGNTLLIDSYFRGYDPEGVLRFDASSTYVVDVKNFENTFISNEKPSRDGLFTFPKPTAKQDYFMHSPLIVEKPTLAVFQGEDILLGLETYVFSYETGTVNKTEFFTNANLAADEDIWGNHTGNIWVEPHTGYIVKFSHEGNNDVTTNNGSLFVKPYQLWQNTTNEGSVREHVQYAKQIKQEALLVRRGIPTALGFAIIALLALIFTTKKKTLHLQTSRSGLDNLISLMGYIVTIGGIIVMIGWIADISILKSVIPGSVTMKFTTAASFMLSGLIVLLIQKVQQHKSLTPQLLISFCAFVVILLMTTILISSLTGFQTGVENLFVSEGEGALLTTIPGRPSIGTMINFLAIGLVGVLTMAQKAKTHRLAMKVSGIVIAAISTVALIGYIANLPILYWAIVGKSTAMALHTSVFFLLIGASLVLISSRKNENEAEQSDQLVS